jgi:hypothetical protein
MEQLLLFPPSLFTPSKQVRKEKRMSTKSKHKSVSPAQQTELDYSNKKLLEDAIREDMKAHGYPVENLKMNLKVLSLMKPAEAREIIENVTDGPDKANLISLVKRFHGALYHKANSRAKYGTRSQFHEA